MGYDGAMGADDDSSIVAEADGVPVDVLGLITEFDRRISYLSFAEITRNVLRFMDERLALPRASVALLEPDGKNFRVFDSTMAISGIASGTVIPLAAANLSLAVERRATVYRANIAEWPTRTPVDLALLAAGMHSSISTPLICGGQCLGTLNAAVRAIDGIPLAQRQLLELLAPRLAFAIHVGRTHEELAESEARFRVVFASVGDGVAVADVSNRRILMVNPAMCTMLGRSAEELLNLTIDALHPADQVDAVVASFAALAGGQLGHALDTPTLRADGTVFLADVAARFETLAGRPCVVAVFRDATSRRQRQQEQVQMQKLESIRTLAAGIAHDFNNLLTGLIGHMSLVKPHLPQNSEPWQMLDEAQRVAFRGSGLTRQLLTFAKGGAPLRKVVDLLQVVQESAKLAVSGSNVQVQFELPQRRVQVMGDDGQLAQVIQNLVRNAVEAMPSGGTARIRVSVGPSLPIGNGEEASVAISDHGVGIAPALLDRVFEPFFTTKPSGSGLGLAAAYSIVQAHTGRINVASEPGVGTTFTIFLPMTDGADQASAPVKPLAPGCCTVLVMDDQAMVRHVAERALRGVGCEICLAVNGDEAIAAYRDAFDRGRPFAAVILDLTVPGGKGGCEAAAAILAIDPRAKLIVSSGYSEDAVMSDYRSHGFRAVLPKPYSAEQLRTVVARLLDATGA
jgi:PAS domain S-box-containing protein